MRGDDARDRRYVSGLVRNLCLPVFELMSLFPICHTHGLALDPSIVCSSVS
jgi:hypothetical protein